MEPNILDLRQERCPMALLLAKRHTKGLNIGEQIQILVSDSSSMNDITCFLQKHLFQINCEQMDGYYSVQVTKESY